MAHRPEEIAEMLIGEQPAEPHIWHPVNLNLATAKARYITGEQALNLWDAASGPEGGIADWHDTAAVWTTKPQHAGDHAVVNIVVPSRTLRLDGVEDAREALRDTGHPGAQSPVPIWKATHARAVIDLAFHRWARGVAKVRGPARFGPISPWTVADWLWTETQMDTVRNYAERAEREIDLEDRAWWRAWWHSLRLGTSHEDYVTG